MYRFKTMVNFIGEQPVPNYLPVKWGIKHLGIEKAVNLFTDRTEEISERLEKIYKGKLGIEANSLQVDPYNISKLISKLEKILSDLPSPIFNLTGGTKPMTFAGYSVSMSYKIPFLYFQSEGGKMKIRMYEFGENSTISPLEPIEIEDGIYNLKEYLDIHFDKFNIENKRGHGGYFKDKDIGQRIEKEIIQTLEENGIEVFPGVNIPPDIQIDLFIKNGHNVGIMEVKRTLKPTAINQIALPSRQVRLGTYIRRFVVGGSPRDDRELKNIVDRAEIGFVYIILLEGLKKGTLTQEEGKRLIVEVKNWLKAPIPQNFKKMKQNLGIMD